ncbi:DUF1770-domain-containing protein [Daldinia caldariorum]|uniref:DUF1770-domain-containing protein n=1 Tax=Daldinia caldariorum TaxID=326644 RepID=UPI002007A5DD|nr:DUF1770-domain-containing protein [Daldinia caldariorum]KAI1467093.1 DUF1770-domain-containing protein [Daldinia caldariorum]
MADSIPTQIAETIQTAHIQRAPSPQHDLNPFSSLSQKQPVNLHQRSPHDLVNSDLDSIDGDEDDDDDDESDIPISVLKPHPRPRHHLPPMPDLRFEQSYLHSIAKADTWWKVAWITVRDQVLVYLNLIDFVFLSLSHVHLFPPFLLFFSSFFEGEGADRASKMMMPFAQGVLYNLALHGWHHWNKNARVGGSSVGARLRRWWYAVNNWPLPPQKVKARA